MTELATARLRLRRWREDDREPFSALNADPDVTRHLGNDGRPLTREQSDEVVDRILRHWDEHGYGLWATEDKATGTFIGFIGLSHHRAFPDDVEVGWRLARPWWGRGLATEGAQASLAFAFGELGLDRVISITTPANVASWRVMEKIGMAHWRDVAWEGLVLKVYEILPGGT